MKFAQNLPVQAKIDGSPSDVWSLVPLLSFIDLPGIPSTCIWQYCLKHARPKSDDDGIAF